MGLYGIKRNDNGFSDDTRVLFDNGEWKAEDGTVLKFKPTPEHNCEGCYLFGKAYFCLATTFCKAENREDGLNGIWLNI